MAPVKNKIMPKVVKWLDPKLQTYRAPQKKQPPFTPHTEQELVDVISRTPKDVLDSKRRYLIASAMTYQDVPVSRIMVRVKDADLFLRESGTLSALVLDRLYKTGFDCFPVLDDTGEICGVLRTTNLDPLKIANQETPVADCLDRDLCFVRNDYSLEMLIATFMRTNNNICIVVDKDAKTCGFVTLGMFVQKFFGQRIVDHFDADRDKNAVADRTQK